MVSTLDLKVVDVQHYEISTKKSLYRTFLESHQEIQETPFNSSVRRSVTSSEKGENVERIKVTES